MNDVQNLITIKGSKYGVSVHMDPEASYKELLEEVRLKFSEASKFFEGSKVAITFEGRILTKAQEREMVKEISAAAGIHIICIMDHDIKEEEKYKSIVTEILEKPPTHDGQFYKGTLKRRQVLESETSVIIIGDVELGAKVIAKGNVIVLGTLSGTVHAGASGKPDAFISALSIRSTQLRIGDNGYQHVIGAAATGAKMPEIAQLDGKYVYIDPLVY